MCVCHQSNLEASFNLGTRLAARSKVIGCVICRPVACILASFTKNILQMIYDF